MSDFAIFVVGTLIFAITVCGTILGVGMTLTRRHIADNPHLVDNVDKSQLKKRFPIGLKY